HRRDGHGPLRRRADRTGAQPLASHRGDQDVRDFGPGELLRRPLPVAEHLAHIRARERDAILLAVRTGLRRAHALAPVAPERVLVVQRRDAGFLWFELLEDILRVVGAVVAADAGVITTDDEVGAPVVLASDRVPDRFLRAGIAHRRREHGYHRAVLRIVALEQRLITLHPDFGRHIVALRCADEWVDQQAIDDLERALLDV